MIIFYMMWVVLGLIGGYLYLWDVAESNNEIDLLNIIFAILLVMGGGFTLISGVFYVILPRCKVPVIWRKK